MSEPLRIRAPIVRAFHQGDATTLVDADGLVRRFDGFLAVLLREILSFFVTPRTRADLLAHLAQRAGLGKPDEVPAGPVDDLLALLGEIHVLVDATEAPPLPPVPARARLVLGVTGAVAAIEVPALVRLLLEHGYDLRIAMTWTARKFVTPEALEILTHRKVYGDLWDRDADCPVPHINLAKWAEAVLVFPATATILSRLARGDCSDLVSAIALATTAPVVLAPSMNGAMYTRPAVRRNLEQLRSDGFLLIEPAVGMALASPPDRRAPIPGPAPPPKIVVELLDCILRKDDS